MIDPTWVWIVLFGGLFGCLLAALYFDYKCRMARIEKGIEE
jgi:hypothetical protein